MQVGPALASPYPQMMMVPSTGMGYAAMPMYAAPQHMLQPPQPPQPPQQPPVTAEQLQQVCATMFLLSVSIAAMLNAI